MTSQSIGSPKPKQSYFVSQKSELMAWQLKVCLKRGCPKKSRMYRVLWHKPQNHLLSGALVPSFSYFEDFLKQLVLSPPSLYMCGLRPKNISLSRVHWVCKRWEQKSNQLFWETYPNFGKKTKKEISSCLISLLKSTLSACFGRYIGRAETMVCLEAWGNVHVRLDFSFGLNHTILTVAPVCQPMLICMVYSFPI